MSGRQFCVCVVVAGLLVVGAVVWQLRKSNFGSEAATKNVEQAVAALRKERQELDETVWAKEVLAQRHEQVFVDLWDRLLARDDPYEVFAKLAFDKLVIGQAGDAETHPAGVTLTRLTAPGVDYDLTQWRKRLAEMQTASYRLVQSEFHHSTFDHEPGLPARSTVSIVLHVTDASGQKRFDISGKLTIQWAFVNSPRDYRAQLVDASELTIKEISGPPAFRAVFTADLGRISRPPNWSDLLVYDLNGDGLPEIVYPTENWLYWNRGEGKFEQQKLLVSAFPSGKLSTSPAARLWESVLADFTGDGVTDLLSTGSSASQGPPTLLLHAADADGHFTTPAREALAARLDWQAPDSFAVGDVDLDGDLDVFVTQYKEPYRNGQMPTPYYDANDGWPSFLLLNDGTGNFQDGSVAAGLEAKRHRRTYRSSLVDLDDDGDLDLLVVSDFAGLDVYYNDGRGKFTDETARVVDERANFGMSHAFGDFNLDGKLDFFVTGMASTTARRLEHMGLGRSDFPQHQAMRMKMGYGNRMYLRDTGDRYRQPAFNDQVARSGWSWGCGVLDFNCDGAPDIYIANGHLTGKSSADYCTRFWCHDIYTGNSNENTAVEQVVGIDANLIGNTISWNGYEKNQLLMNEAGGGFLNVGFLMGVALEADSRQVVATDFDADGRPDLLVVWRDASTGTDRMMCQVFRNEFPQSHHWIGVRLRPAPGISAIGAKVAVHTSARRHVSVVTVGDSFACQHPMIQHFGLGATDKVESIEVQWVGGKVSRLMQPAVDQYYEISPGAP